MKKLCFVLSAFLTSNAFAATDWGTYDATYSGLIYETFTAADNTDLSIGPGEHDANWELKTTPSLNCPDEGATRIFDNGFQSTGTFDTCIYGYSGSQRDTARVTIGTQATPDSSVFPTGPSICVSDSTAGYDLSGGAESGGNWTNWKIREHGAFHSNITTFAAATWSQSEPHALALRLKTNNYPTSITLEACVDEECVDHVVNSPASNYCTDVNRSDGFIIRTTATTNQEIDDWANHLKSEQPDLGRYAEHLNSFAPSWVYPDQGNDWFTTAWANSHDETKIARVVQRINWSWAEGPGSGTTSGAMDFDRLEDLIDDQSSLTGSKGFPIGTSFFNLFRTFKRTIYNSITGAGSNTVVTLGTPIECDDSGLDSCIGYWLVNVTDNNSTCRITAVNSQTNLTCDGLVGGTDNTFTSGDTVWLQWGSGIPEDLRTGNNDAPEAGAAGVVGCPGETNVRVRYLNFLKQQYQRFHGNPFYAGVVTQESAGLSDCVNYDWDTTFDWKGVQQDWLTTFDVEWAGSPFYLGWNFLISDGTIVQTPASYNTAWNELMTGVTNSKSTNAQIRIWHPDLFRSYDGWDGTFDLNGNGVISTTPGSKEDCDNDTTGFKCAWVGVDDRVYPPMNPNYVAVLNDGDDNSIDSDIKNWPHYIEAQNNSHELAMNGGVDMTSLTCWGYEHLLVEGIGYNHVFSAYEFNNDDDMAAANNCGPVSQQSIQVVDYPTKATGAGFTGADATMTLSVPDDTAENDLLYACVVGITIANGSGFTVPGGWTTILEETETTGTDRGIGVYVKDAGPSETSYDWSWSGDTSNYISGVMGALRGAATAANQPEVAYVKANHYATEVNTGVLNAPDISPGIAGDFILTCLGSSHNEISELLPPADYALVQRELVNYRNVSVATKVLTGSSAPQTIGSWNMYGTPSAMDSVMATVALSKDVGGGISMPLFIRRRIN